MEEILDVQRPGCPREFFNIPVPKNHPFNPDNLDNLQMPLQRSRFNQRTGQTAGNPRQQVRNDPCMTRTHIQSRDIKRTKLTRILKESNIFTYVCVHL